MKRFFLVLMMLSLTALIFAEWTIAAVYSIPEGASGLAFDGTYLYCGIYGANGDEFYRIDPANGTYQLQFSNTNIGDCFGMTWDGANLWITDHVTSPSVPATAYELDINTGTILSQFDLPAHYVSGIAYDAGNFWVAAYYPDPAIIYKVDSAGNILQQFTAPDNQPWDLCLQNADLWMADYWGDTLYQIDPATGTLIESHASEGVDPAGIVWDGQYLWYCDNGAGGFDYLYKVDLGGAGTPQMVIDNTTIDFGIVTVGETAWDSFTISNNGNADLEINFGAVTGSGAGYLNWQNYAGTISSGGSTIFNISYSPQQAGMLDAIGIINSNDPLYPQAEIHFLGTAVNAGAEIFLPETSHNYGSVRLNAYTRWWMEVQNVGDAVLTINDITFDDTHFSVDNSVSFPLEIPTLSSTQIGIWFSPDAAANFSGTLSIHSNDPATPIFDVLLSGIGDDTQYDIGTILWQYQITTSYDNSPKAIAPIEDINGDDVGDVIVCSEDNFVRCFNGNASITGDILWEHEIASGDVYQQNALAVNCDLNGDDYDDVVVGTVGGDRAIRCISGYDGQLIWIFNTNSYGGSGGWVYQVDVTFDFNNDGVLDVLAASGSDANRVMCLDGTNGSEIWNFYLAGPKFSCIGIADINNDGVPDAIGGGSNATETVGKVWGINGATGAQLWEFSTSGSSVWGLAAVDDFSGDGIEDVAAGDFGGNYYGLDTSNGNSTWNGSIGTGLIIRFEKLNDVNGNGHPDIAIARSTQDNAIVIDGYTGDNIWLQPVADQPWVVDKIGDLTGDGVNEVVWGTLFGSNFGYFLDGATGAILSQTPIPSAVDAIAGIPDIAGDGSWEMVCGGRNGEVICISGGEAVGEGMLEGMISLNGGSGSLNAATVQIGTTTVTVDPTGYYSAFLSPGFYDVTFSLATYETLIIEDVEIISEQTTTLDVTLNYCFAPQNLSYTVEYYDVILEWDAPQTSREVESYKVYRDGTEIAEVFELTYTDEGLSPASYEYHVTAIYSDGQESEASNTVNVEITSGDQNLVPLITKLNGNFPNPFNPSTKISFDLAEDANVELMIYNLKGQIVKTLISSHLPADFQAVNWNGTDDNNRAVASGLYFYKLKAGTYSAVGKCLLLK